MSAVPAETERTKTNPPDDGAIPVPPGVDPTVGFLVQHLSTQAAAASRERGEQTQQFTASLDKLGGRFEAKMDAQTNVMVKAATIAAGIVVLTLLILGAIAGAVTYFRGFGIEAGSKPATATTIEPSAENP